MADDQRPGADADQGDADACSAPPPTLAIGSRERRPEAAQASGGRRRRRFGLLPLIVLIVIGLAPRADAVLDACRRRRATRSASATAVARSRARTSSGSCSPARASSSTGSSTRCTCIRPTSRTTSSRRPPGRARSRAPTRSTAPSQRPGAGRVPGGRLLQAQHRPAAELPRAARPEVQGVHVGRVGQHVQDTFRQQIESALQQETRRHTVAELFGDADVLDTVQTASPARPSPAAHRLARPASTSAARTFIPGGECGPITFVIKKIDIPTSVQARTTPSRPARTRRRRSRSSRGARGQPTNYAKLRAIEEGKVTFWILPDGADVVVPGPDGHGADDADDAGRVGRRRPRRPRPEAPGARGEPTPHGAVRPEPRHGRHAVGCSSQNPRIDPDEPGTDGHAPGARA